MHRAKRNTENRAYKLGYTQGAKGHAKEGCPYFESNKRGAWMGGWRQGHASFVAGYRLDWL